MMNKLLITLLPFIMASCAADGSFESWQERADRNRADEISRLSEQAKQRDTKPNEYAYNEGTKHGCNSGHNTGGNWTYQFQKDVDQYVKNEYYKTGWNDGFAKCKAMEDQVRDVINATPIGM